MEDAASPHCSSPQHSGGDLHNHRQNHNPSPAIPPPMTSSHSFSSSSSSSPSSPSSTSPHNPDTDNDNDHNHNDSSSAIIPPPNSEKAPPFPAHTITRLIQCSRCSRPLRTPLRLPCGNTLCRACLPPVRDRMGISYPAREDRKQGFTCYWEYEGDCDGEHCLGDCGSDVLLTRLVDVFERVVGGCEGEEEEEEVEVEVGGLGVGEEGSGFKMMWETGVGGQVREEVVRDVRCSSRGLLGGMYDLVKGGRVDYDASGVEYEVFGGLGPGDLLFEKLKEAVRNELDCQVCYSLILDPLTTSCGHTFCRACVAMVMNHSDLCPVCRRKLNMDSTIQSEPANRRISEFLDILFPEQTASRREALKEEEAALDDEGTLPLFVSSLSLPTMPTFLHVFEPRYRLMMRRVMNGRERKFGMVMFNRARRPQQELGRSQFMQYGTVLMVDRFELLPDGRSLVIATGVSRFKVISSVIVDDGYHVGKIERVDDVSITQEERREVAETAAYTGSSSTPITLEKPLGSMSTQELFQLSQNFVQQQRSKAAPWLHPRVLLALGDIPTDPSRFPWWFASVLPVWEEEKYALLPTTSVRERLKINARWVRKLQSREWSARSRPSVISVLWLAAPLLIFCLLPLVIKPITSILSLSSPYIFTTYTPFSMSVSVSFGSAGPWTIDTRQPREENQDSETYISKTLVIGVFLAIFVTQVAANAAQIVRSRRRERIEIEREGEHEQEPRPVGADVEGAADEG